MEFEIGTLSIILIVGLLALISIGVPMGFASGFMGAVLVFLYIGEHALGILLSRYYSLVVTYSFLSVPLFIFMASLLERSNIARDLYDALNAWLRKTRGGVGVVTAIMATIMAAMSGIIGGEIVLLGLIALPQMLRLKYDQDMSIGIICASGSLGTMIPPSIVLIIYGLTTETSITMLFQEAIVPGLMISGLIITYILIRTRLQPHLAPLSDEPALNLKEIPKVDLFLLTHNHYDHQDTATIRKFPYKDADVIVPLKLGKYFTKYNYKKVNELDWYQTIEINDLKITLLPAVHWSKRSLTDTNKTLWGNFLIEYKNKKILFACDTGYGNIYKDLGKKYGPIDLTMINIGAYDFRPMFEKSIYHTNPEEALQVAKDLKSRKVIGTHWGTFVLSLEPIMEPPVRFKNNAENYGFQKKDAIIFKIGEIRPLQEILD